MKFTCVPFNVKEKEKMLREQNDSLSMTVLSCSFCLSKSLCFIMSQTLIETTEKLTFASKRIQNSSHIIFHYEYIQRKNKRTEKHAHTKSIRQIRAQYSKCNNIHSSHDWKRRGRHQGLSRSHTERNGKQRHSTLLQRFSFVFMCVH